MKRLLPLCLMMLVSLSANAGGVNRVNGLGARALGMGGAFNAVANDGSAIYYNVAGLTQAEDDYIQLGADLIFPRFEYEQPEIWGGNLESKFTIFPMPLFVTVNRLSEKTVRAFGLYPPYGLGVTNPTSYHHGLMFRKSKLALVNFTYALAYQLTDDLSIGAGLDLGYGQLVYDAPLHQIGNIVIDPVFMRTKADGFSHQPGYRLGLRYQPTDNFAWGFSYSTPMEVKLKGKTDISIFGLGLGRYDFITNVTFPARYGTGIEWWVGPKLKLALDANYYDYNRLDRIVFDFDFLPKVEQKMQFNDNCSFHTGIESWLSDNLCLRAGIAWLAHAIPEETTNPIMPDADGWGATFGVGYAKNNWSIDAAYTYSWANRKVEHTFDHLASGNYALDVHTVSFSFTRHF